MLFALFLVAGLVVTYSFFFEPWTTFIASRGWQKTPCVVTVSRAERAQGPYYRPNVQFRYTFAGAAYSSARIQVVKPSPDTHAETKALIDRYPEGLRTTCWVDPADPRIALLDRSFQPQLLIALFPLALALVGLTGLLAGLVQAVQPTDPELPPTPAGAMPVPEADPRPVRRKARGGFRAFAAAAIFALLWNSPTWFLLREVVAIWSEGVPGCHGWLLTVFTLPFVIIGLFAVVAALYLLLKMFSPRPRLRLSSGCVPAGGYIDVTWRFTRWIGRINRLRVYVEGREEATYRRGKKLATDREVFITIPLVDTAKSEDYRHGRVRLNVPADAPPSFQSRHNRVAWAVCIAGEIRRFPDVYLELEFIVVPSPQPPVSADSTAASSVPPARPQEAP